jgi:hypothetical protein
LQSTTISSEVVCLQIFDKKKILEKSLKPKSQPEQSLNFLIVFTTHKLLRIQFSKMLIYLLKRGLQKV